MDKRTWTSLTEFGTFTSAVKCFQCSKGFVIPYPTLLNSTNCHLKDGKAWDRDYRPTLILPICSTVKLDFKELLIKEQIDFMELFTDYQLFYTINLLLNKELLLI